MPTPFQLVLGVAVLVGLGVLFVFGRQVVGAWLRYRDTRVVVCPENREVVAVEVDAGHAAWSAPQGRPDLRLEECTRWPEKAGCGQECLSQIESAPEACRVRTILADWYQGKACAFCGRAFGDIHWHDHKPGASRARRLARDLERVQAGAGHRRPGHHRPVCWDCHQAESFRREHPELVTETTRAHRPAALDGLANGGVLAPDRRSVGLPPVGAPFEPRPFSRIRDRLDRAPGVRPRSPRGPTRAGCRGCPERIRCARSGAGRAATGGGPGARRSPPGRSSGSSQHVDDRLEHRARDAPAAGAAHDEEGPPVVHEDRGRHVRQHALARGGEVGLGADEPGRVGEAGAALKSPISLLRRKPGPGTTIFEP